MAKYKVETDKGTYIVETEDAPESAAPSAPAYPAAPNAIKKSSAYKYALTDQQDKELGDYLDDSMARGIGSTVGLATGGLPGMFAGAATTNPKNVGGSTAGMVAGALLNKIPGTGFLMNALKGGLTGAVYSGGQMATGQTANPLLDAATGAGVSGILGKLINPDTAKAIMQNGLRLPNMMPEYQKKKIVDTLLKEGININEGGQLKLEDLLNRLKGKADATVANSPKTVDALDAWLGAENAMQNSPHIKGIPLGVSPPSNNEKMTDVLDMFLNNNSANNGQMPLQRANDVKTTLQSVVRNAGGYEHGASLGVEDETRKALTHALVELQRQQEPALGPINDRIEALLRTDPELRRAVNNESKKFMYGLGFAPGVMGSLIGGGHQMLRGDAPESAMLGLGAAILTKMLNAPGTKSRVARAINAVGPTNGNPQATVPLMNLLNGGL